MFGKMPRPGASSICETSWGATSAAGSAAAPAVFVLGFKVRNREEGIRASFLMLGPLACPERSRTVVAIRRLAALVAGLTFCDPFVPEPVISTCPCVGDAPVDHRMKRFGLHEN